jgi:transposase
MDVDLKSLPDDASLPKDIVLSLIDQLEVKYQEKIHYLEEQLGLFKNELFGRSSEKRHAPHPDQVPLFTGDDECAADSPQASDETVIIAAHSRKNPGRKALPKELPRVDIIHDLSEEQKQCGCGARLSRIGEAICEKLDYVPARLRVERHIRYKYACKSCEGVEGDGPAVRISPAPLQLIRKSNATAGLLAHIAVCKFADGLPLYRQQKIFERLGIEMPRAVTAKWMVQAAQRCAGLIDLLKKEIRSGPLINIDESPLQVLNEAGRKNTSKSYMWVYRGGQPDRPAFLYRYHRTRSGRQALDYIGKLYQIEKEAPQRQLDAAGIYQLRQEKSKPLLDEFKDWLGAKQPLTPPKGLLGQAISYTQANWNKLIIYLEDGRLRPDNNLVENAIRPFVLGRKNWLFAGSPDGAMASATFFSLIETAKANGLEPYAYLRYIFENLPLAQTEQDLKELLPQNINPDTIAVNN